MKQIQLTIITPADTPENRAKVALFIAQSLYGAKLCEFPGIPYSDYPEKLFWVLDDHNDWFLHFNDENPQKITVRHRDPQPRHELILGALAISLRNL